MPTRVEYQCGYRGDRVFETRRDAKPNQHKSTYKHSRAERIANLYANANDKADDCRRLLAFPSMCRGISCVC